MSLSDFLLAAEKGAASIYHDVLTVGPIITEWEADHPAMQPLIQSAVTWANGLLTRFGIPTETLGIVGADIIVALKALAANDATVQSVPKITTTIVQSGGAAAEAASAAVAGLNLVAGLADAADPALTPAIGAAEVVAKDFGITT